MFLLQWLVSIIAWIILAAIALVLMDRLEFGIKVESFGVAFFAAFSIGVLKWLIQLVVFSISLWTGDPQQGLISVLIGWVIAALILYFVSKMRRGFEIRSFGAALLGALVLALLMTGMEAIIGLFIPS